MSTAAAIASTASGPPAPSPILRYDFPGWLPPMLVKELRQGLRTRGFVGALVIFQLLMLLLTLVALSSSSTRNGVRMTGMAASTGFFWTLIGVQLLLATPARALNGLQLEVESRTLDLLMLTRLDAWRIVLGKWISLLVQGTLLLVSMLPYLIVRYFTDQADILGDLGRCIMLLGFCAVLTAAGLWTSGVAKALRVFMVVLVVFWTLGMGGSFGPRFFGFRVASSSAAGNPLFQLLDSPLDVINAALITAYFLISAVRNIAPVAENHCFFTRILPLLALLPAPFAKILGAQGVAERQLAFGAAFLALVLMFELALSRDPMPSHWREWRRGGGLRRVAGRGALPGWASAFLFGLLATGVWMVFALIVLPTGTVSSRETALLAVRLALLAFAGFVFPAVLRSFLRPRVSPPMVYFCALVLPLLLAGVSMALAESMWKFEPLRDVMVAMPVSSFLFALPSRLDWPVAEQVGVVVAIAVLVVGGWQTRSYWQQLRLFEARDRAAEKPA